MIVLRHFREKRGLTQVELSKKSFVSQQLISKIEQGLVTNPGVITMNSLARALKCTVDDLIVVDEEDARQGERREEAGER